MRIPIFLFTMLTCTLFTHFLFSGFAAGTLVKTPKGYQCIEDLRVGDFVYSITPEGTFNINKVTHTTSYALPYAIKIITENDIIIAAPQQKFYLPHEQKWISAKKLDFNNHLGTSKKTCFSNFTIHSQEKITDFFDIRLDGLHTFCISTDDIIVHNFPLCFIGFTIAWGSGKIALEGVYFGVCIAGWWLGTKLLKGQNSSKDTKIQVIPLISRGSPDPDDDDKKKKHPYGRYQESPKHHPNARNGIGKPPINGQEVLDNSVQIKNGPARIAIENDYFVVLRETSSELYHGYIVNEFKMLQQAEREALFYAKLVRHITNGGIIK